MEANPATRNTHDKRQNSKVSSDDAQDNVNLQTQRARVEGMVACARFCRGSRFRVEVHKVDCKVGPDVVGITIKPHRALQAGTFSQVHWPKGLQKIKRWQTSEGILTCNPGIRKRAWSLNLAVKNFKDLF